MAELLAAFDFLGNVNPTLKIFVYILILVHILALGIWCVLACPGMFAKNESFSDKVEKALKQNK
jgi:hypothetical protein